MVTRRMYEAMAAALNKQMTEAEDKVPNELKEMYALIMVQTCVTIGQVFLEDNPAFDMDKFMKACAK